MFKKKLPTKRVVIAGCRNYYNYTEAKEYIDYCLSEPPTNYIGHCRGEPLIYNIA